jgi:hypothetical protein
MRVKLCGRCPYTPRDLADHYDPLAALYACAKCDREQAMPDKHDLRETQRRQKCSTSLRTSGPTLPSVAPFATESSASFVTIRGEPLSVQGSALISSSAARKKTASGYGDFARRDNSRGNDQLQAASRFVCRNKVSAC